MTLPPRAPRLEWNLNTLIQLMTLFGMIIGGVMIWTEKTRDIDDLQNWRSSHEQYHKERLAEVKSTEAANAERFRTFEARMNDGERKIDQLTYRVTVTEQSAASITNSIKDLQALVNKTAGDLQVVREILQRMEARVKKTNADPDILFGCADNEVWISQAGIYHTPDSPWRTRMQPVKCYETAAQAEHDGYRPPKPMKDPDKPIVVAQ